MLCFAGQNVPGKMDGEASPAGGCRTRSFEPGSWPDPPHSGTASSGFFLTTWTFKIWKMSRTKAFVFTSSTLRFWGESRRKASASHLLEGRLARKLRLHIFHFQILRDVSLESVVWATSTFTFWGRSRTRGDFWKLADARKAVFCRTKRALEDGWGSFSGGRLRHTLA